MNRESKLTVSLWHLLENSFASLWRKSFKLGEGFGGTKVILTGVWAGESGRKVLVGRKWSGQIVSFMKRRGITELDLCHLKSDNCDFLLELPFLTGLRFCARPNDISAIDKSNDLKYLDLGYGKKPNIHIDPRKFPALELFYSDWHPNLEPVFDCIYLKDIAIEKFPGKQGSITFAKLVNLQRLWLSCSGLEEIENFKFMRVISSLELLNMNHLKSLHGVENLPLKKLRIESCKSLEDIEPVRNLKSLEFLSINDCGEITSLAPLKNLINLEVLHFSGNTKILDGDLSVLSTLPKLREVLYQKRNSYSGIRKPN